MPLPNHPGGTITFADVAVDTNADIIANIKTRLVASGWTATAIAAYVVGTFTGVPANNQTIVVNGQTYTFKTTLTPAANEVLIGGTAAACASNLFDAITDNSANEGTTYGTGTTANATFTASINSGVITITALTAGTAGNGLAITEGLNNYTQDSATSRFGGESLKSVATPQGLQCICTFENRTGLSTSDVSCRFGSADGVTMFADYVLLAPVAARVLKIRATRYDFWLYLVGSKATAKAELFGGTLFLKDPSVAKVVLAVANSGGLYEIETAVAHGRVTGDSAYIAGATGQTGINGNWATITVTSTTKYTLDGSTYAAGYTANSARAAGTGEIARCVWQQAGAGGGSPNSFRSTLVNNAYFGGMLNQYSHSQTSGAGMNGVLKRLADQHTGATVPLRRWGNFDRIEDPMVAWEITAAAGTYYEVGMLWGAMFISQDADFDKVKTDFDTTHDWVCLTDRGSGSTVGSLWLATS